MPIVPSFDAGYSDPFWRPEQPAEGEAETESVAVEMEPVPPQIIPPERDLRAEVSELLKPLTDYLTGFVVAEKPDLVELAFSRPLATTELTTAAGPTLQEKEFNSRKATLERELCEWSDRLTEFLTDHRSWSVATLRSQHATAWQQARDQKVVVDALAAEGLESNGKMRELNAAQSRARLAFQTHDVSPPDLDALPSQAQLDDWQTENERLRAVRDSADQAVAGEQERQRSLGRRFQTECAKLAALKRAEADLRARLSGEEIRDTGLLRPPEV
jgi:hypothetical protein